MRACARGAPTALVELKGVRKSMFRRVRCINFESVTPSRKKVTGPNSQVII